MNLEKELSYNKVTKDDIKLLIESLEASIETVLEKISASKLAFALDEFCKDRCSSCEEEDCPNRDGKLMNNIKNQVKELNEALPRLHHLKEVFNQIIN